MAQDPLSLLCVEPYFPGRIGPIADWLVRRRGYRATFFCHQADDPALWPDAVGRGLEVITFNVGGVAVEPSVHWSKGLERGLCYAYGAWEVYDVRRPRPIDAILGRSAGLGSDLFASVTYPGIPRVNLFDYYYHPHEYDLAGEPGVDLPAEYYLWRRSANAMDLLDLDNDNVPVAPTRWQKDLYPKEYRDDFRVIYDGVDARRFARATDRPATLAGRPLPPGARIVSFVNSAPDWLRGFDRFVALANRLIAERPEVICVVVGGGPVARMLDVRHHAQDYVRMCLEAGPPPDPDRFWNLGLCRPSVVSDVLNLSDLHVYPSRPYPVAKSMVEAMSSGAVVLAWDTEPVREFLEAGRTGLLVPPGDPDAAVEAALRALDDPAAHRPIGEAAAALVRERYAQDACLPEMARLLDGLLRTP